MLDAMLDAIERVGAATGRDGEAVTVVASLRERMMQVRSQVAGLPRRRVFALEEVWAVDADSFLVRPGPWLMDGVELLAGILHPDAAGAPSPAGASRLQG